MHVCLSFPHGTTLLPLENCSLNKILEYFSKIFEEKLIFFLHLTRITGALHEDLSTFMIISRGIPLRMRIFFYTICRENQNTQFMFSNSPPPENRPLCKIM